MLMKYIVSIKFITLILLASPLYSSNVISDVAIFSIPGNSPQLNVAMLETEKRLYTTFSALGRFIPAENAVIRRAVTQPIVDTEAAIALAESLDLKACVIITIYP